MPLPDWSDRFFPTRSRSAPRPFLLVHGDSDPIVPYQEDVDFRTRLLALGVPCDLITIRGDGHGMLGWAKIAPKFQGKIVHWLQQSLPPHP